jgi:hypothetical protein
MYPTIEQTQFTFILVFTFSSFHTLDLVSAASTPWAVMVLAYLPSRHHMARGESTSLTVHGAPDYRQNQQNRTIRFEKLDRPVFPVSSSGFWLLFHLC